jgi:ketosteroid isomerase-like protein
MRYQILAAILLCAVLRASVAAQAPNASADVVRAVEAFHAAVAAGNAAAAAELLAADAVIVEGSGIETREQFVTGHLPLDIEFEKSVPAKRGPIKASVHGDAAWTITTSEMKGTFQGRAVDLLGAETMVLAREAAGWRIKAIHWSSRARPKQ